MGSSRHSREVTLPFLLTPLVLSLGAVLGIVVTAAILARKDPLPHEDLDAPLFI